MEKKYPHFEICESDEQGETNVVFETENIYIFVTFKKNKKGSA